MLATELRVSPVPSTQPSPHTVLGFAVADPSAVMNALSMRGVEWARFANFPQDAADDLVTPDGAKVACFRDPDGNLLSVVQSARRPHCILNALLADGTHQW
jgi:catechol 2,3-dioxygenase-like lactoylglutathione lyase family enzyme